MTREEFFNKLNAGAKWNVGVSIARTNPLPLDANEIFESVEKMEEYIATNLLAYPGQLVVVLGTNETAAYLVKTVGGNGKGYSKLMGIEDYKNIAENTVIEPQIASYINGLINDKGNRENQR